MTNKIIKNDPCNEKLLFLLLLTLETVQGSDDKVYPSLHIEYLPSTLHIWQSSVSSTLADLSKNATISEVHVPNLE